MSVPRKIVILGVGGTIAGQGNENGGGVGYKSGQIAVADLMRPAIAQIVSKLSGSWVFEVEQVAQLDSKDMDIETWQRLAAACIHWLNQADVASIVITHGTDTLEETAWFLHCVLQPTKPVVLTCAMRPANALSADGPVNLRDALCVAAQGRSGVWAVVAGEVHGAQLVRKVHPYRLNAFDSGAQGPAAWVEEGRVRWAASCALTESASVAAVSAQSWSKSSAVWPWVEIVTSTAAAHPQMVCALVDAGVQGLIIAATGNGSVHQAWQEALHNAEKAGVVIWRSTRCEQGQLVLGCHEVDANACALSPVKARISMMLALLQQPINFGGHSLSGD